MITSVFQKKNCDICTNPFFSGEIMFFKKQRWKKIIMDNGIDLRWYACDMVAKTKVPDEIYTLFTEQELSDIKLKKVLEKQKIEALIELLDE